MIFDLLEDLEPVNFFKFVIHPQSFSQTVENIFYLSFLIRDAKAYVHVDDSNNLILGNVLFFIQKLQSLQVQNNYKMPN